MISSSKKDYIVEYLPAFIRMVRVSSFNAYPMIEAIEEVELGEGSEVIASSVRKFCGAKTNGYLNGTCVVYPERRVVRQVVIEAPKGKETEFVFNFLHDQIENAPPELAAHCLSPKTGKEVDPREFGRKEALICGVPHRDINELQQSMLEHAIYPKRLELGTVGILGAVRDVLKWKDSKLPALLLELDERCANAVIIGANGIEISRRIGMGSKDIAESLKLELNLKDEDAAIRLLSSEDFDDSTISKKIIRKLHRELQSSIGYYEVQTGQLVNWIHTTSRSIQMGWLERSLEDFLNLESLKFDVREWLESVGVSFASDELSEMVDSSWLGLFSSLCTFDKEEVAA
tara:strand:- start:1048 stop:2082 length:1035 start_codon:yes stop_codon:yes gene_type:complete